MIDEEKQLFIDRQFANLRKVSIFLFPVVAFLAFRAQDILPFLFGKDAEPVIFPFQIIIWSIIFIFNGFLFLRIALVIDKKSTVWVSLALEAIYMGILCFFLIPLCGLKGVASAALVSTGVMYTFIFFSLTSAGIKMPLYKSSEKPAIAAMGLMVTLHYIDSLPFVFIFAAGVAVYFFIFVIISWLERGIAGKA